MEAHALGDGANGQGRVCLFRQHGMHHVQPHPLRIAHHATMPLEQAVELRAGDACQPANSPRVERGRGDVSADDGAHALELRRRGVLGGDGAGGGEVRSAGRPRPWSVSPPSVSAPASGSALAAVAPRRGCSRLAAESLRCPRRRVQAARGQQGDPGSCRAGCRTRPTPPSSGRTGRAHRGRRSRGRRGASRRSPRRRGNATVSREGGGSPSVRRVTPDVVNGPLQGKGWAGVAHQRHAAQQPRRSAPRSRRRGWWRPAP